jgi:hypothetical protein
MRPYRSVLPAFQAAGRPLWPLIGITTRACGRRLRPNRLRRRQAIAFYAGVWRSGESR